MKHFAEIVLATIWIIIAIILIGLLSAGLNGSLNWGKNWNWNWRWGNGSIPKIWSWHWSDSDGNSGASVDSGEVLEGEETLATSFDASRVEEIETSLVSESVYIEVYSGTDIEVSIVSNLPESTRPRAFLDGSTLKIERKGNFNPLNFGIIRSSVTIKVPKSMISSWSNLELDIDTVSGSVSIDDMIAEKIDVNTTSGSIKINNTSTKEVNTESISGSTRLENCVTDKLDGNVTSGSFHFEGTCTDAEVGSVSGSVHFDTDKMLKNSSEFGSVSGSVKILLPQNDGFVLDYQSVSGRINNEFTGFSGKRDGKDRYGNGGITINAETVSGSISVEKN